MNATTAVFIVIILAMIFAFIVKVYSIKMRRPVPKSLLSELLNVFGIILRGIVHELKRAFDSDLKPEDRLKALINVIIVALFLITGIFGSVALLVYTPFGGKMCAVCAVIILALGLTTALIAASISIHKVF